MVFIKLTAQAKHTCKHSEYGIQANDLAVALAEAETENPEDVGIEPHRTRYAKLSNIPYVMRHSVV